MSDDLIRRSDARNAIIDYCENDCGIREEKWCPQCQMEEFREVIKELPSADIPSEYIHINDVYRLVAGHSDYHGDSILAAFTCLTEGKEVKPIHPLDRPSGEWVFKTVFPNDKSEFPMGYLVCSVCGSHHSNSEPSNFCDNCGADMRGADDGTC